MGFFFQFCKGWHTICIVKGRPVKESDRDLLYIILDFKRFFLYTLYVRTGIIFPCYEALLANRGYFAVFVRRPGACHLGPLTTAPAHVLGARYWE